MEEQQQTQKAKHSLVVQIIGWAGTVVLIGA